MTSVIFSASWIFQNDTIKPCTENKCLIIEQGPASEQTDSFNLFNQTD